MRKRLSVKKRLKYAKNSIMTGHWEGVDKLDPVTVNFFKSQLRNLDKNKYKRTFSLDDKILALAIFKKSPKTYRFLSNLFTLPSAETIRKVVRHIPIKAGICKFLLNIIKIKVNKMKNRREKCCILLFDEMAIKPNLQFNKYEDIVEGFADDGINRNCKVADHVAVWMLKSVTTSPSWKQPIAYTFSKGPESWPSIMNMYKNLVRECEAIGLHIVASVCDQGVTNSKAIKQLILETKEVALRKGEVERYDVIKIGKSIVIPLFDPPHLLKCIRNNLLTKNLKFVLDGQERVAKWSHIEDAYFIDRSSGNLRAMPKLTDLHVVPNKIKKMSVAKASQVFSTSVASIMSLMSRSGSISVCGRRQMSREGEDTAVLLQFFDKLFDSVNGGIGGKIKKLLRQRTTTQGCSPQERYWDRALTVIRSMSFIKVKAADRSHPEVLQNWQLTLNGFKLLRLHLTKFGFSKFSARVFNQDALENFFGQVRQHGVRNINPTVAAFGPYYKSLLINNFNRFHSKYANCEADESTGLLVTLKQFVSQVPSPQGNPLEINLSDVPQHLIDSRHDSFRPLQNYVMNYFAGYIAKFVMKETRSCDICASNILHTGTPDQQHAIIVSKDIGNKLNYCNVNFVTEIARFTNYIEYIIPQYSARCNISDILYHCADQIGFFLFFVDCPHKANIQKKIKTLLIKFLLFHYFKNCTQIMNGVVAAPEHPDAIQILALDVFRKNRKYPQRPH
ncbi:unnamed protein product [Tenebrio molitor]|nr:unnamed protein product [Tenebrio molitor]